MRATVAIALDWAIRCFGREHVYNDRIRSLRVAEEAVELAQACHVPKEKMLELVEIVYSRPVGDIQQEIGGVLMTTCVLGARYGWDMEEIFEAELLRVLSKSPAHFTARNEEKIGLGLR